MLWGMTQTVEWLFDARSEAWVRDYWDLMTSAGLSSLALHTSPSNRPHLTAVVCRSLRDDAVTRLGTAIREAQPRLTGLETRVDGLVLLGGRRRRALALHVVPDLGLLGAQAWLRAHLVESEPGELTEPGRWTPHVSLARRVADHQLGPGVAALGELARRPLRLSRLRVFDDERGVLWES
jgi:hypothetical protein